MDKRTFIRTATLAGAGVLLASADKISATGGNKLPIDNGQSPFSQIKLPYSFDSLEPYIDAKTMEIHYSKHHAAYTKNFVTALDEQKITTTDITEIFKNISKYFFSYKKSGWWFL